MQDGVGLEARYLWLPAQARKIKIAQPIIKRKTGAVRILNNELTITLPFFSDFLMGSAIL
ncbi:hypothetical protein ACMYQ1_09965 [Shewanella oncorhynchi]|uniref:hypothetical protein n=1 Tax=Shewanella oncorhynchi TaxID=2726434 RepID=UPI0039F13E8C